MTVWREVVERLRATAEDDATRLERWVVVRARPLRLEELAGGELLEEGDDDFDLSDDFRQYRLTYGVAVGDVVRVLRQSDGWLAMTLESGRPLRATAGQEDVDAALTAALEGADTAAAAAIRAALTPEAPHFVGTAGEPAFQNSWVNFDAGASRRAAFYKAFGRVWLEGCVRGGATGTTIFTLPAGYRPVSPAGTASSFGVDSNGAFGRVGAWDDGRVILLSGAAYVFLDSVNFRV